MDVLDTTAFSALMRGEAGTRKRMLLEERKAALLAEIRVLDWIPEASVQFGSLKASLERRGAPVDDFDIAVAAIAVAHGAGVVTANVVHFSRIDGLRSRHWTG